MTSVDNQIQFLKACISFTFTKIKLGILAFIMFFGELKKTTKKRKVLDENGEIIKVSFNDAEFGDNIQVTINRIDIDKLSFDFYLEDSKE